MKVRFDSANFVPLLKEEDVPPGASHAVKMYLIVTLHDFGPEIGDGLNANNVAFGVNLMFGRVTHRQRLGASEEERMKVEDQLNAELEEQDSVIEVLRKENAQQAAYIERLQRKVQGG